MFRRAILTPFIFCQTARCGAANGGELKRVDTIARVRRAFHGQGWSVKKIVRELHVSRNTVRKILRCVRDDGLQAVETACREAPDQAPIPRRSSSTSSPDAAIRHKPAFY